MVDAAARFALYLRQRPVLTVRPTPTPLYPVPVDGFRDDAPISFHLSKMSTVALSVAGAPRAVTLPRGRHTLRWRPGRTPPALYYPRLVAVDLAGNRGEVALPPIEVRRDVDPPDVTEAVLAASRLTWSAFDEGTPWLRLSLALRRSGRATTLALGKRPLRGSLTVKLPEGSWDATLVALDSSGNRTAVPLGPVAGRG